MTSSRNEPAINGRATITKTPVSADCMLTIDLWPVQKLRLNLRLAAPLLPPSISASHRLPPLSVSTFPAPTPLHLGSMDPRVRDLYRRFLFVGRDYPLGLRYVRDTVKRAFKDTHIPPAVTAQPSMSSARIPSGAGPASSPAPAPSSVPASASSPAALSRDAALHRAVTKGRYMVREMEALIQLKKYRQLRKAYGHEQSSATVQPSSADLAEIERMVGAVEAKAANDK